MFIFTWSSLFTIIIITDIIIFEEVVKKMFIFNVNFAVRTTLNS